MTTESHRDVCPWCGIDTELVRASLGLNHNVTAVAVSFARTVGDMVRADPERRFDITPSVAAAALLSHARRVGVAVAAEGDGPEVRRACAESLWAIASLLAGLHDEAKGRAGR